MKFLFASLMLIFGTFSSWAASVFPASVTDFNVYSVGDIHYSFSDFEGRAGAGGNVQFRRFFLGAKADRTQETLLVGGSAILADGSVRQGGVRAVGDIRVERVDVAGSVVAGGRVHVIDSSVNGERSRIPLSQNIFEHFSQQLLSASDKIAALSVNSTVSWNSQVQGLVFYAQPNIPEAVFNVSAEEFADSSMVFFSASPGTLLIVNVTGDAVDLKNKSFDFLGGVSPSSVLYNFSMAETLSLEGVKISGMVLAPRAAVLFESGALDGNLYAGSLRGNGQVNEVPVDQRLEYFFQDVSESPAPLCSALPSSQSGNLAAKIKPLLKNPNF